MKNRKLTTTAALIAVALPLFALPKTEQTDSLCTADIAEVIIAAPPKENDRLRQQSFASTSLSVTDIHKQHIQTVKSLSCIVPNLFIPDYGSKLTTSMYIRGIGSRINTPSVGLYVDNIPYIDKSAFDFNYADIERIDVLRGPQSTLYGRNTMGGLIRLYTKSPFSRETTNVQITAATYNQYKAYVSRNQHLSEQIALSASAFYEHKGGFFTNAWNKQKIDHSDEAGGKLRMLYLPNENLELDLNVNYEYTDQGGYPYQYTGIKGGHTEDRPNYVGQIAYNRDCGYKRHLLNGGLSLKYEHAQYILHSITGFQYLSDHMQMDQDFTEKDIYSLSQEQDSKSVSEELILKSPAKGRRWEWTTGISGIYQGLRTNAPVSFHNDGLAWLNKMSNSMANKYMPSINNGPMTMKLVFNDEIQGDDLFIPGDFSTPTFNAALFHQSTFNDLFTLKGLSLTAGLRLDYESIGLDYYSGCTYTHTYSLKGQLFPLGMVVPMVPEQTFDNTTLSYEGSTRQHYLQLLPKVAIRYAWDAQSNIYASVTKGYRSGGYNIQMFSDILRNDMRAANMKDVAEVTIPVVNQTDRIDEGTKQMVVGMLNKMAAPNNTDIVSTVQYKPEYSWNYEIGTHLTLCEGKVTGDIALFYMNTYNQQISRFAQSGLGRVTLNAGKSRSIGAEGAIKVQPLRGLQLQANYGYTHATFTDYVLNEQTQASYNGNCVPFVPQHNFAASAEYRFELPQNPITDYITLHANYKGAGRIYWTEDNSAYQNLYGTLNGSLIIGNDKGEISLWMDNVLNTRYQAFYFETMNRGFAQMGRPMQMGVDIRLHF